MKRSSDRILTTHAGRLSDRAELADLQRATEQTEDPVSATRLNTRMAAIVRKQIGTGIDVISDGELGRLLVASRRGLALSPLGGSKGSTPSLLPE